MTGTTPLFNQAELALGSVGAIVFSRCLRIVLRALQVMSAALVLVATNGCMGYVPGKQSYWDAKVEDMCKADGGMTTYEQVLISQEDYRRFNGSAGVIFISDERSMRPGYPFASRTTEQVLNDDNPRVVRRETYYFRRSDRKVLAKAVEYSRVGGDVPSFGHPSMFYCPSSKAQMAALRMVFKLQGDGE